MRNFFIPPGKSLTYYALLSWAVPGAIAIILCFFAFFGSSALEYRNEQKHIESRLADQSKIVARRISAEMLLGKRGATKSVSELLKKELGLSYLEITRDVPPKNSYGILSASQRIPFIQESYFVTIGAKAPDFWSHTKPSTLLWSTLPIALMLGLGIGLQSFILRRYFIKPMQALVDTSTGSKEAKTFWPEEIRDLSSQLYRSFEVREKEVFSQIARGVVHDLRTLIHSPLASVELVEEASDQPEKRLRRLESLYAISAQQLPKMRDIIDNTLDGSRDISVRSKVQPIGATIDGALRTLDGLLKQSKTELLIDSSIHEFSIVHDQLQLERAITNLVKNGIEANQENKNTNKIISLKIRRGDAHLTLDVEDSGSGINTTDGKLFRPLKSTKAHGSGLGLIVTRKIVEAHGGILVAGNSEFFGGAKFSIQLPMTRAAHHE